MADRRNTGTLIVDKPAQYRLLIPFGFFWLMCLGLVFAVVKKGIDTIEGAKADASPAALEVLKNLGSAEGSVVWTAIIGSVILGALCFAFWLIYSHRIFGPITPIRRHVLELINGNYDSKITLRNRDEMTKLADDLNNLANKLKEKYGKTEGPKPNSPAEM